MKSLYKLKRPVYIAASATVAGYEESLGPLSRMFDICVAGDDTFGCPSWEKAESEMQRLALSEALAKALLCDGEIDIIFAGDLLNQCIGSAFGLCDFETPFAGLYGACSTCALGLLLGALFACSCEARVASLTSSHNASAERQFRSPLEYGGQRPPTSQYTVTASGAYILTPSLQDADRCASGDDIYVPAITELSPGRIVDAGINDANNMGAAMAPACADTLLRYFSSGGTMPSLILTGDLGYEGSEILKDLMKSGGKDISPVHEDCGLLIYDRQAQDKHAGGSGCGCSAAVLGAKILEDMRKGRISNVLFLGTGALMNPMSIQQGQTIPAVAHLVRIESFPLSGEQES